ncbi:MAG: methionyl-tRNA formyltransferase [Bacteroidaceae bacterium]|nr:methionyl-tRNA formyltransferase [Bacteroidaceae bacterium]
MSLRIIFMGTPDFAVESLRRLVEDGCQVVAVVTMPDKAIGRHHDVLQQSPVKQYALSQNIPVLQPERLKDETFLSELRSYHADLQVVVAFRMLPEVVWAMPRLGTFNLHAALLPQYRGAAPINWAIINGEKETGITTFFLDHDIDTGQVIYRQSVPIHDDDDAEAVHDRLMLLGADLVLRTVHDVEAGQVRPIPQSQLQVDGPLRPAPKIFKETCQIRWADLTAREVYNFVRGLSPYPAAWTTLNGTMLKIYKVKDLPQPSLKGRENSMSKAAVEREESQTSLNSSECEQARGEASNRPIVQLSNCPIVQLSNCAPGTIMSDGKTYLHIACREGWVSVLSLQLAGKRRMSIEDFLRGAHIDAKCVE